MQYLLMLYSDFSAFQTFTPEQQEEGMAAYMAYAEALKNAGVLRGQNRLRPTSAATTLRVVEGKSRVLDGPYADTKEQLGGYFLIEVPDHRLALTSRDSVPTRGASVGRRRSTPT